MVNKGEYSGKYCLRIANDNGTLMVRLWLRNGKLMLLTNDQ